MERRTVKRLIATMGIFGLALLGSAATANAAPPSNPAGVHTGGSSADSHPDKPTAPDTSNKPDNPNKPDNSNKPEVPSVPDNSNKPDKGDKPGNGNGNGGQSGDHNGNG